MAKTRTTKKAKGRKRGSTRFPGIVGHAAALGVNRVTLFRALTGAWCLPGLVVRYNELLKSERN